MLWPIPEYDERDYKVSNGIWTIMKLGWIMVFTWLAVDYVVSGPGPSREVKNHYNRIITEKRAECFRVSGSGQFCAKYYPYAR